MANTIKNTAWQTPIERMSQAEIDNAADGAIAIVFNTTTNTLQYYDGSSFVDFGGGGALKTRTFALQNGIPSVLPGTFTTDSQINIIMKVSATGAAGGSDDIAMVLLNTTTGDGQFLTARSYISASDGDFAFYFAYPSWDLTDTIFLNDGSLPAGFSVSEIEIVQDYIE